MTTIRIKCLLTKSREDSIDDYSEFLLFVICIVGLNEPIDIATTIYLSLSTSERIGVTFIYYRATCTCMLRGEYVGSKVTLIVGTLEPS